LFAEGDFDHANLEYSRVYFYSREVNERRVSLNMQARCLLMLNRESEALFLLRKQRFVPDSIGREIAITQLQGLLKTGALDSAIARASDLISKDREGSDRYLFYRFLARFQGTDMGAAEQDALALTDSLGALKVKTAFGHYRKKHKNPTTAFWLSLVPGMGQLYSRDYRNTVNSMVLNGAIIGFSYWQYSQDRFRGVYLALLWLPRYFTGGMKNAKKSAIFYNNRLKATLLNEVLTVLGGTT
jgi:hypothetical protein